MMATYDPRPLAVGDRVVPIDEIDDHPVGEVIGVYNDQASVRFPADGKMRPYGISWLVFYYIDELVRIIPAAPEDIRRHMEQADAG